MIILTIAHYENKPDVAPIKAKPNPNSKILIAGNIALSRVVLH